MSTQPYNDIDNQYKQSQELIRSLVELSSGWPTVLAPYQGPSPGNQYCSVWFKHATPQQYDIQESGFNSAGDFEYTQKNETYLRIEIKAMGNDAMSVLNNVISKIKAPARFYGAENSTDPLVALKNAPLWQYLGYGGHDDIQDISVTVQGKTLPQAVVNVYFYANFITTETIEGFDVVDIGVSVKDNKEDIFTVTIGGQINVDSTD